MFASQCPYFLERCLFMILRAAALLHSDSSSRSGSSHYEPADVELLWDSLKMLRSLPADFTYHVSDQIAVALFDIIR